MNIDEAKQVLAEEQHNHHSLNTDRIGKAILLSIQALIRVQNNRKLYAFPHTQLLPGETED